MARFHEPTHIWWGCIVNPFLYVTLFIRWGIGWQGKQALREIRSLRFFTRAHNGQFCFIWVISDLNEVTLYSADWVLKFVNKQECNTATYNFITVVKQNLVTRPTNLIYRTTRNFYMAHIKESHRKFFLARFKSKPRVLISSATVNKHFKNLKVHT